MMTICTSGSWLKLNFLSHQDNGSIMSAFSNEILKGEDDFLVLDHVLSGKTQTHKQIHSCKAAVMEKKASSRRDPVSLVKSDCVQFTSVSC